MYVCVYVRICVCMGACVLIVTKFQTLTRGYELRLNHVADKEDHHAGIDFICHGPSHRIGSREVKINKRILTGNKDDDEDEFQGTQRLSDHLTKGRRREVSTLDLQPWVAILRDMVRGGGEGEREKGKGQKEKWDKGELG